MKEGVSAIVHQRRCCRFALGLAACVWLVSRGRRQRVDTYHMVYSQVGNYSIFSPFAFLLHAWDQLDLLFLSSFKKIHVLFRFKDCPVCDPILLRFKACTVCNVKFILGLCCL